MTKRLPICLLLAIAITAACASGTGDSPSPSTSQGTDQLFPNWPPLLNDFRFHWTAEPVIDLTMGPAVAVRAYLESYDAATFTLDPNNVYPGFLPATPANQEREGDYLTQLTRIRPLVGYTKGPKDAWTHYGFVTYHVLHLNPKGNAFEAIVCGGEYSHFVNSLAQPGKFVSVAVNEATGKPYTSGSGLSVHRIEFTQSDSRVGANPPAPVAAPQRGPAPAPDQDVFGNWFITAAGSHYWGPINDPQSRNFPTPDLERQCAERMPQNEAERTAMMSGFKDEPPPPDQAEPGLASQSQLSSSMPMCTA